jgi:hypothetical protein
VQVELVSAVIEAGDKSTATTVVALLVTVMVAQGNTAPVESLTSPVMVPRVCAKHVAARKTQTQPTSRIRRMRGSFRKVLWNPMTATRRDEKRGLALSYNDQCEEGHGDIRK